MNWMRVQAIFLRYFYTARKGPHQLSDLFYWPLIDILLWGLTSIWVQQHESVQNLTLFLMTGLILWQVTWRGSIDLSLNLLQEFWQRNLVNLFASPLQLIEWQAAVILFSFCKTICTILFSSSMIYLLYSVNVFSIGWSFLPFVLLLLFFGWTISFIASGLIIYYGQRVESLAWTISVLFFPFSAVFYPVTTLPSWAQYISFSLPTTYIFEGMRMVLQGGTMSMNEIWIALSLDGLYFVLSLFFFRRMFQWSLNQGLGRLE